MDEHAQHEIRVYADAMGQIVRDSVPLAWEAFEDYQLYSVTFSKPELELLAVMLKERNISVDDKDVSRLGDSIGFTNKRERSELAAKLDRLGILKKE